MSLPRLGVVIVTMGTRPQELRDLLASVEKQDAPAARVVLVGNATPLTDVTADVTKIPLEANLGCPGGRNVGLKTLRESGEVDVVIELDDDGLLIADDVFRKVQQMFAADPKLGIIGFRVADEHGHTERRWVPRLRADDPMCRGLVTAFLGGGHAFSVPMLNRIGDWAASSSSGMKRPTSPGVPWTTAGRSFTNPNLSSSTPRPPRPGMPSTTDSRHATGCGLRAAGSRSRLFRCIWASGPSSPWRGSGPRRA